MRESPEAKSRSFNSLVKGVKIFEKKLSLC